MVEILGHGEFFSGELELVPEFRDPVMLKSGGPIMEVHHGQLFLSIS